MNNCTFGGPCQTFRNLHTEGARDIYLSSASFVLSALRSDRIPIACSIFDDLRPLESFSPNAHNSPVSGSFKSLIRRNLFPNAQQRSHSWLNARVLSYRGPEPSSYEGSKVDLIVDWADSRLSATARRSWRTPAVEPRSHDDHRLSQSNIAIFYLLKLLKSSSGEATLLVCLSRK